jgi:hypothetical protein
MKKILLLLCAAFVANQALGLSLTSIIRSPLVDQDGYYTVEIQGTGFGTGPNIVLFDDFDNQTSGENVDLTKALIGQWHRSSSYEQMPKVVDFDGGKAFQIHDLTKLNTASIRQIEVVFPEKVSNIFISYSVTVPEGKSFAGSREPSVFPNVSSWKFTWITDTPDGIASQTLYNVCTPTHGGQGSFLLAGNSVNYGWVGLRNSWSWHTKNYMSFGIKPDPAQPKEKPGQLIFQMTGKKDATLTVNKVDSPIFPTTNTTSFDRVKFPGWFGNGDQSNFDAYYDDIYVATGVNSFARVELSDNRNFDFSIRNITLPISSWSDTKIIAKLHKNNLQKFSATYIRLYDTNNISATHKLECALCPMPPIPIR